MFDESLISKVRSNISEYNLIKPGFHIVAGISGGADSVCLLKALTELRDANKLSITAVHVNHLLRGKESDGDEEFVAGFCESLNIPLKIYHEDIRMTSEASGVSIEEAGRDARYSIFFRTLREVCGDVIAVAHNFEDQAETVMMNILRGCGAEGLAGMDFKSGVIIRPLLNIRRQGILDYLAEHAIGFRTDSSNLSCDYSRNRIRNNLFPFIQKQFSVDPSCMLNRLSVLSRRDDAFIEGFARQEFQKAFGEQEGVVVLDASVIAGKEAAVSSRMIRMAWERITGGRKALESNHIDKITALCRGNATGKSLSLPGGVTAWISYGNLMIGRREKRDKLNYSYPVSVPGATNVAEAGGTLTARILDKSGFLKESGDLSEIKESSKTQIFDYLKIKCGINIRNRRDGDRIRPLRSMGERKLKEFFIDRKIQAERRDAVPLVATGSNILWVIGMRTSEDAKPDEHTEAYLILNWSDKS